MALIAGSRLGVYEVTAQIGAGGMGQVFRARDTRLHRDVALKVLPDSFATDAERLARFTREAQTLASLNHPNIAHLHGLEESGGMTALVMELVEGEDLSAHLVRGPMPFAEVLPIARQIAGALDAAHEQGIIHRDLKPANIKIKTDGTVKVLDFGLAKAMDPAGPSSAQAMNSPTITTPAMTQAGVILGTAAYMAPEQAKGRPVDKRADIWAFGVVLFEMLSGGRAFGGADVADTLASVLKDQPGIDALPATVTPAVRQLLRRCLQKDPRARLRDIGDARLMLDEGADPSAAPPVARRGWATVAAWVFVGAMAITALVVAVPAWRRPATPATPTVRFAIPVVEGGSLASPVLSNDGTFLVYDTGRLYLRHLSEFESRELPGTAHAIQPFLSPDGKWVGFYADGKMKKVALAGGEPLVITEATSDSPGATFVSADRILFTRGWNMAPLLSVSADGGAVTQVSTLDTSANERGHWWPRALPDGRHVLFTIWYADAGLQASRIAVLDLETGTHRVLFPGAMAQYAAGHLLYYRAGQYHIASFDPSTLAITADSRAVLPDALGLERNGSPQDPVSLGATGTVAYWPGELDPRLTLTWVDRGGRRTPTPLTFGIQGGDLSADGRHIAIGRPEGGSTQVWVYDLAGGEQRLQGEGANWGPVWHREGRRLAYTALRKGDFDIVTQNLDGAPVTVFATDRDEEVFDWLLDGRMVVREWLPDGTTSVFLASPDGKQRTPLVSGGFDKVDGRVSADGRWLALCAAPSGRPFLYVQSLSEGDGLQQLAPLDTVWCNVRWSAGVKELVFMRGASLVALAYEERGGRLSVLREAVVATVPLGSELFGVTQGGQRFLLGIPASPPRAPSVRVIIDGIAALRGSTQ